MKANSIVHVLLVEDEPGDAELIKAALGGSFPGLILHVVSDGEKAAAFIGRKGPYAEAPRPTLVLLDLNLPRKDGREFLKEMKGDPALRDIPVIILTTSAAEDDVSEAYAHGANCYISKPFGFPELQRVLQSTCDFWLNTVRLPTQGR